jgi:hypothetical protein
MQALLRAPAHRRITFIYNTCTYIHTYIHAHTHTHIHTHTQTHNDIHLQYVYMYTYTNTHAHTYMCICMPGARHIQRSSSRTSILVLEHVERGLRNTQPAILNTLSAPHASSALSIRQHTSAYASMRQHTQYLVGASRQRRTQHTSAYVSIRQHTSAYSIPSRRPMRAAHAAGAT